MQLIDDFCCDCCAKLVTNIPYVSNMSNPEGDGGVCPVMDRWPVQGVTLLPRLVCAPQSFKLHCIFCYSYCFPVLIFAYLARFAPKQIPHGCVTTLYNYLAVTVIAILSRAPILQQQQQQSLSR